MFGEKKSNSTEIKKLWERLVKLEGNSSDFHERLTSVEEKSTTATESQEKALTASRSATQHNAKIKKLKEEALESSKELKSLVDRFKDSYGVAEDLLQTLNKNSDAIISSVKEVKNQSSNILSLNENAVSWTAQIEDVYSNVPEIEDKIRELEGLIEQGEENSRRISNLHLSSVEGHKKIEGIYEEIHGYELENEELQSTERVDGLKDKLEKTYHELKQNLESIAKEQSQLTEKANAEILQLRKTLKDDFDAFLSSCNNSYDTTYEKISKLLPAALTAGLSSAYEEKIKNEENFLEKNQNNFDYAIKVLVAISFIPFLVDIYLFTVLGRDIITLISDTPKLLLAILPVYFPVLWYAYSSSKKINLSKRLIEEYTHKSVLSKTFEGLSNQINNIEEDTSSNELRIKLLFNILSVNMENPGKLISDYNTVDHPLMDAIDKSMKYSDSVDRLNKVPGLAAIAKKLTEEGKIKVNNTSKKVSNSIADLNNNDKEV